MPEEKSGTMISFCAICFKSLEGSCLPILINLIVFKLVKNNTSEKETCRSGQSRRLLHDENVGNPNFKPE